MKKTHLPARLSPDLIHEIQERATAKKTDVDTLLSMAIDALKRDENTPVSVAERVEIFEKMLSDRMQQVEQNMLRLIGILSSVLPILTETEDRAFRSWANSKVTLAWSDLVVSTGGMPASTVWQDRKAEIIAEIQNERDVIKSSRTKNEKELPQ